MNKINLYINMQVTHNTFGTCIIQNIWTFKNEKFVSLKLNETLEINNYNLKLIKDNNIINYIVDNNKTKIEFLHYNYSNIFEYIYTSEKDNNFNKHGQKICSECGKEIYEYIHITYQNNKEEIFCTECAKLEDIMDFKAINELKHKCLLCNNEIEIDSLFCKDCYNKYKNKSIFLKVENLSKFSYFDETNKYESSITYTCKDGHKVRSKAEREIDNYLYEHNIRHTYEKSYPIDDNPNNDLHPDFYLPDLDVYIEHWGYKNKNYEEEKNYKLNIYHKDKVNLIETTEEDMKDIETNLTRKLKFYKK